MLDASVSSRLTHQLSAFRAAWLADADPRDLAWRPPTGQWSALLNLAHVGRHHEVMRARLDRMSVEENPTFPRYTERDDPGWSEWEALGPDAVLARLQERREALAAWAAGLSDEQLRRTGVHQRFGPMDVPRWLEFFLVHEAHHLYVVLQRLADARSAR